MPAFWMPESWKAPSIDLKWQGTTKKADLVRQAAYLFKGMADAHGFSDGNKRTAVRMLRMFLEKNGASSKLSDEQLFKICDDIVENKWSIDEVDSWLRREL